MELLELFIHLQLQNEKKRSIILQIQKYCKGDNGMKNIHSHCKPIKSQRFIALLLPLSLLEL